jgi:hypothetical protein
MIASRHGLARLLDRKLEEAERELAAARGRTALNAASTKLHEARRELKRLDETEKPKRSPSRRGRGSRDASS